MCSAKFVSFSHPPGLSKPEKITFICTSSCTLDTTDELERRENNEEVTTTSENRDDTEKDGDIFDSIFRSEMGCYF